jgi:hypothetical protein
VTEQHTAVDYARVLKELSDMHFAEAEKIVLAQDNRNTHKPASLRSLSGFRGMPSGRTVRVALHPKTQQLAESGGIRTQRRVSSVPRRADPRQANLD